MKNLLILLFPILLFSNFFEGLEKQQKRHLFEITNFIDLQSKINPSLQLQLLTNIEKYFYCPEKIEFNISNITNSFKDYWNDDSQEQKDTYNKCLCDHYILNENKLEIYDNSCSNTSEKTLDIKITSKEKLENFCLDKVRFKPLKVDFFWGICPDETPCKDNSTCNCSKYQGNKKIVIPNLINKDYFDMIKNTQNETYLLEILNTKLYNNPSLKSVESFSINNNYISKNITVDNDIIDLENKINLLKLSLFSQDLIEANKTIHIISEFNSSFLLDKLLTNDTQWTNPCDNSTITAVEGDFIFYIAKNKVVSIYKLLNIFDPISNKYGLSWISLSSISFNSFNTRLFTGYCSGGDWNSEVYEEFNDCEIDSDCGGNGATCISAESINIPEVRCQKNPNLNIYYTNSWFLDTQKKAIDRLNDFKSGTPLYSNRKFYSCIQNEKNYFGNEDWRYWHRKTLLKKIEK